jgi:16S rRNA (cytosine967-C5)-methyltransferase
MNPAARSQAAIDLLDQVITAARENGAAADTLIARYFSTRRYAGSKDRRAVRELVYAAIRGAGDLPENGRAALLRVASDDPDLAATFDGSAYGPAVIAPDEPRASAGIAPRWLIGELLKSGLSKAQMPALIDRAPLDVRVNRLKATRDAMIAAIPDAEATPHAPDGIRLPTGTNVEALPEWADGAIEVQDEGSQIVGMAMDAKPGQRIVDLCAGAGGKTLALVAAMNGEGAILACDTDRGRLSRLAPRAERAGTSIIETRLLNPGKEYEMLEDWRATAHGVLVDAPCSGTGTWRRNPEARWRLTTSRLARLHATQGHVLDTAAILVRPGGALVYIVCSLLDAEGPDQVALFLDRHPGWSSVPLALPAGRAHRGGVRLDPASDGTDGFFVARLTAPC